MSLFSVLGGEIDLGSGLNERQGQQLFSALDLSTRPASGYPFQPKGRLVEWKPNADLTMPGVPLKNSK